MTELETKVLQEIERRGLAPRPAAYFLARRSVFWLLAAISISFGAVSFAILFQAATGIFSDGWEVLDNVPFEEMLQGIPFLWLPALALFTASAWFGLRHTRRGYRWTPVQALALALVISAVLGGLLHGFDAGSRIHSFLTSHSTTYRQLTHIPFDEWSRPAEGRLGGRAERMTGPETLEITDFQGQTWIVDLADADIRLDKPPVEEGDVAITGTMTAPGRFKAEVVISFD